MAGLPETSKWFFACALASLLGPGSVCAAATETVLYSFQGGFNAAFPYAGVIEDASGNLYGTTYQGNGAGCGGFGCGTVYKLAPDGTESLLHAFQGGADGAGPHAGLIEDPAGNLYGTTDSGGAANAGTVFVAPRAMAGRRAVTAAAAWCSSLRQAVSKRCSMRSRVVPMAITRNRT
ncbi:MAG: choice-of-anchor tandem repeat GloVer-containing protein [Rhizomicrobium sp.]